MPRGTNDPDRVQRIAGAALEVVTRDGVEGLTHRAVAKHAAVPLGSTTYYYKTLDDLLVAAMETAKATTGDEIEELSTWFAGGVDLLEALCGYLVAITRAERPRTVIEYDFHLAALRRPALQQLSRDWSDVHPKGLPRMTAIDATSTPSLDPQGTIGADIESGRTLPSAWYTSESVFDLEQRSVFRRSWQCVCHLKGG